MEDYTAYYEIPSDPAKYGLASEEELKDVITQYLLLYAGDIGEYSGLIRFRQIGQG